MEVLKGYNDGNNVIISMESFEHLLNAMANQKYTHDNNATQNIIDIAWRDGMEMLQAPASMGALNATEALYGFGGWLTSRPERVVFSSNNDAALMAELINAYADMQSLPAVRESWNELLVSMRGIMLGKGKLFKTWTIGAIFAGADGSVGYKHGQAYKLKIFVDNAGSIFVEDVARENSRVEYESLLAYLKNWHFVQQQPEGVEIHPVNQL